MSAPGGPRPSETVRRAAAYLRRHGVESPEVSAELLLAGILDTDRSGLYLRADPLDPAEARAFGRALCRRCAGEPLQHITGTQGFRWLQLAVRPGVFIPRPETEVVVEVALAALRLDEGRPDPPIAVDVGTGSGAIALALADEAPGVRVLATDRSEPAVRLARENAHRLGLSVEVFHGDLLDPLPPDLAGKLALVVANPPYIGPGEHAGLPAEVLADPPGALLGGVEDYRRLAAAASVRLRSGGHLVVEVGDDQGEPVAAVLGEEGFVDVEVLPDLTGRDRVVRGRRP